LERRIAEYRGSSQVSDMLCYHFGAGIHGPARRGKRLRPQLLIRVSAAYGAALEDAIDAAAAIELLHNYSLVHDDIEDRDDFRHGRRTLWSRYGIPQAINAGDAICALSFLTLTETRARLLGDRVVDLVRALHHAHAIMCDGQSNDLAFERATHVGLDEYNAMIAAKTAALFAAAAQMGALCATGDARALAENYELGHAYGMAFQIRDDVHGIWATSDATGKVSANDLARRKWTFPVVWALSQPPSAARERIASAYARQRELEPEMVTGVIEALEDLGAREAANRATDEHLAVVERHPAPDVRDFLLSTLQTTRS
jgi:geranylgeranyl diphosphate synthase type I